MHHHRCDRTSCIQHREGGNPFAPCEHRVHRRRTLALRGLVARAGASKPRVRRVFDRRPSFAPVVTGHHDYGDGRIAVEFEGPSLDLMLYHDGGVTLAEWVTTAGDLIALVPVFEC